MKKYYYMKQQTKVLVDMEELIEFAEELGYDGDEYGVRFTSGAARYLRDRGYEVGENHE